MMGSLGRWVAVELTLVGWYASSGSVWGIPPASKMVESVGGAMPVSVEGTVVDCIGVGDLGWNEGSVMTKGLR